MNITTCYENKRGCGYRKPGGLYLMAGNLSDTCEKLPIKLDVCPCCHAGIKPSRSWTWVTFQLIKDAPCRKPKCKGCHPFDGSIEKFGLLWIGEKFYSTPYAFNKEAITQGISRRIKAVPKDFVVGETWVLLAHRKCILDPVQKASDTEDNYIPGIFCVFKPDRIEYVVKADDDTEKLEAMEKRGITLVDVKKAEEQIELPDIS